MTLAWVSRAGWGARAPKATTPRPTSEVIGAAWHHTGALCLAGSDEPAVVRGVQAFCMDVKGYWDIDYDVLIGPSGAVYEGRGGGVVEAAQTGTLAGLSTNVNLFGICFLGDFTNPRQQLTPAAVQAAQAMLWISAVAVGQAGGRFALNVTHNWLAHAGGIITACPGVPIRNLIAAAPFHGFVN